MSEWISPSCLLTERVISSMLPRHPSQGIHFPGMGRYCLFLVVFHYGTDAVWPLPGPGHSCLAPWGHHGMFGESLEILVQIFTVDLLEVQWMSVGRFKDNLFRFQTSLDSFCHALRRKQQDLVTSRKTSISPLQIAVLVLPFSEQVYILICLSNINLCVAKAMCTLLKAEPASITWLSKHLPDKLGGLCSSDSKPSEKIYF